jgi:peptide/nickel transport system substrate-binding protein
MPARPPLLRSRVSRRAFSAGAARSAAAAGAASLASGAVLGACASHAPPSPVDANATPTPGGTLRMAFFFDYDNLDPAQGGFAFPVFQRLYSYLHHVDGRTLEVIPDLSTSYEQPDDLTYVFALRRGVRFHDIAPASGREVTAHDVVYSMNRLNTVLNPIDPGFMSRVVDRVEATDDYAVRITNKRPYASTMQVLGGYWYAVVPQEAVDAWDGLSTRALGSGPFILERFEQESGASLRRNPGYYRPGLPYLDGMELSVITDPTNLLTQFRTRALDVNSAPLDNPRWEALKRELKGVQSSKTPGILDPWIGVNLRRPPFNDIRVRRALDLAIDRREMIKKLAFGDGKLNGPIPWGNERWALPQQELEQAYRTDIGEARALLAAAGAEGRAIVHRVTPALPLGDEIGTMLKEQLRPLGFDVRIDVHEQNDWIQTVILEQDFDTCGFAWFPVLDPTVSLRFVDRDDIFSGLMFGFDDAEIAGLYAAMQGEFDAERRRAATWELQRAVLAYHGPVLHTFDSYMYGLWWPWVRNWEPGNLELNFYSAEHWLSARG